MLRVNKRVRIYRRIEGSLNPAGEPEETWEAVTDHVCAHLDGSGMYFYRNDADFPESGITGDMTIQAWVKIDSGSVLAVNDIVRKWSNAGQFCYLFRFGGDGKLYFNVTDDGTVATTRVSDDVIAVADTWLHVAVTYDASEGSAIFYVDGAAIGSSGALDHSIFDGTDPFIVGSHSDAWNLDGSIAHVAIFDDIRTAAEILESYNTPLMDLSGAGNIIAQWHFNDPARATTIDNSQGDSGRDLIPYNGGDTTFGLCGREVSNFDDGSTRPVNLQPLPVGASAALAQANPGQILRSSHRIIFRADSPVEVDDRLLDSDDNYYVVQHIQRWDTHIDTICGITDIQ